MWCSECAPSHYPHTTTHTHHTHTHTSLTWSSASARKRCTTDAEDEWVFDSAQHPQDEWKIRLRGWEESQTCTTGRWSQEWMVRNEVTKYGCVTKNTASSLARQHFSSSFRWFRSVIVAVQQRFGQNVRCIYDIQKNVLFRKALVVPKMLSR